MWGARCLLLVEPHVGLTAPLHTGWGSPCPAVMCGHCPCVFAWVYSKHGGLGGAGVPRYVPFRGMKGPTGPFLFISQPQ